MKDNVQPTPIDWEQRKYDLAVALYYHDIRLSDVVTPEKPSYKVASAYQPLRRDGGGSRRSFHKRIPPAGSDGKWGEKPCALIFTG